ncbi:MAG: TonB-dependent receptor [Rhizobacter sp.]|nr:TonB-dependent receptor [Rhizobacter sp.]
MSGQLSQPVQGEMSAADAIAQALQGTALEVQVISEKVFVVKRAGAPGPAAPGGPASSPQGMSEPLAVTAAGADAVVGNGADGPSGADAVQQSGSTRQLEAVVVTGSRLKRLDSDGPAPVNTYTRADIDRSGQPSLERFLSSLNEASVSPGESGVGQTTGQGSVQLRGLPLGSTLVLLNGRRLQAVGSSSANFFNLDLIPLAAVDRVEVVPVGSSAVYGGDALAGVVNIILKKSLDGMSLDLRGATAQGTGDGSFSLAGGRQDQDGSFLLLGSYSSGTPLTMSERAFFRDGDYRRFDGVDARGRGCTPGTVESTDGSPLPGLSSSFAGIPTLAPGQSLTVGSFAATDGVANLCNTLANGHGDTLVYGKESFAFHASGDRRLGDRWNAFGELTFNHDRAYADQYGLLLNRVTVPAGNAYNPFGTPVVVTSRLGLENGAERLARKTNFGRVLGGVRGEFGRSWEFEASLSTTRDDGDRRFDNINVNSAALAAALGDGSLNPFASGTAASEDVLRSIWTDSVRTSHGRKDQGSAFVRGPLFELPAGKVDVIAGAEVASDHYQTSSPGLFDIQSSRRSNALFGEMRVPLWRGGAGAGPAAGWDVAALTLAGRRDHYSDFGSAGTYQGGLEWRPMRSLLLRGSVATSFKPPTVLQTSVDDLRFSSDSFGLVDPARGNAPIVGAEVLRTTNPNLTPEKGRAQSLGFVWEPDQSVGTRVGVTAWRVRIKGLISLLWPQVTLDNEALFPGFITREPSVGGVPGAITRVLYAEVNFGGVETAGTDLELSHAWRSAGTRWTVGGSATRTHRYEVALTPDAPVENRLGVRNIDYWAPKWKGRLFAGLERGGWGLGLTSRYLGTYRDAPPSERPLGGYWTYDVAGSLDLKRLELAGFAGVRAARLSLGIVNLGDHLPEYVGSWPYYDATQGDWRGRYFNARLSVDW